MLSTGELERSFLQWKPADQFCYALSPGTCPIGVSADAKELLGAMVSQRAFEADLGFAHYTPRGHLRQRVLERLAPHGSSAGLCLRSLG
eukprot:9576954-Alexandrium_andersonii.AAC.2